MKIQTFHIISCMLFQLVKMESDCSEQFRCLNEFLKEFINNYQKMDIVIKETDFNDDKPTKSSKKIIEITSNNLDNFVRRIIKIFKSELGYNLTATRDIKTKGNDADKMTFRVSDIISHSNNKEINHINNHKNVKLKTIQGNKSRNKISSKSINSTIGHVSQFDDYYEMQRESDNTTDYPDIDYIDIYKDTTNEPIKIVVTDIPNVLEATDNIRLQKYTQTQNPKEDIIWFQSPDVPTQRQCHFKGAFNDLKVSVFPWIATIFLKNGSNDQFDYYCDGIVLSERFILTSAQCLIINGSVSEPSDVIVILGKRSLLSMGDNEKFVKIIRIKIHDGFKMYDNEADKDIAVLQTEENILFSPGVQPACLINEDKYEDIIEDNEDIVTTGWAVTGELTTIAFDKERSKECDSDTQFQNIFCLNYSNEVTVCPSYGSLVVTRASDNIWYLRGLRTGDPSKKGFCYNNGVFYTDLVPFLNWIKGQQRALLYLN